MNPHAPSPLDPEFRPADPGFAARVRASFGRQKAMALIGAALTAVEAGRCEIELPYRDDLTQQKGFVHGGIIGMIADSACGYAAYTLMPAHASLVTVEYKINVLAPGRHDSGNGEVLQIDQLGFRGPEIERDKGELFRIIALGESTTFDVLLRPGDRAWTELLDADPARLAEMGERARQRVFERHSADQSAGRLMRLFGSAA